MFITLRRCGLLIRFSWFYTVKALNQARLDASLCMVGKLKSGRKWPTAYTLASSFCLAIALFHYLYHPLRWVDLGAVDVAIIPIMRRSFVAIRNFMLDINVLMLIAGKCCKP